MRCFPEISCRDDLNMLIYQGYSARMIHVLDFKVLPAVRQSKHAILSKVFLQQRAQHAGFLFLQNLPFKSQDLLREVNFAYHYQVP